MQALVTRAEANTPSSSQALRGALVVAAATLVMGLGFGGLALPSVFIAPFEAVLGWSRSGTSLAYTLATIGMAAGGLYWGRLADRVDLRILFLIGAAAIVASLAAQAVATALWQYQAANLVLGAIGFSALYTPVLAVAGRWFERRRGLAVGIVTAGGAVGQGVMPWAANLLIEGFGWRAAYGAMALAALAGFAFAVPVLSMRPPAGSAPAEASGESAGQVSAVIVPLLAAAAFLCCLCMGVPLVHLTAFIAAVCGSSEAGTQSLLVAMLCGAVGRVFFGMLADRIGALPTYALASFIQTACVIVYPMLEGEASIMALSAVFGFGFAGNMTCLILCVREAAAPGRFGASLGLVLFIAWGGMGVGGYVGGLAYDIWGSYAPSFHIAFVAGVANLAVLGAIAVLRRPGGAVPATA